jgi:NADP-dependent 3-hydroxy acid dehydrogenase YdfG
MLLKDKIIIITGASSGIGEAAAHLFAQNGAHLVLGARRSDKLKMIAGLINRSQGRAVMLAGDVADPRAACAAGSVRQAQCPMLLRSSTL